MLAYPKKFLSLIEYLKKLPGVGQKTAERFAFDILSWKGEDLTTFATFLHQMKENIIHCEQCGCLCEKSQPCFFCSDKRDHSLLCVVGSAKEVFSIEQTHMYQGLYHVLSHLISPLEGKHSDTISINEIIEKIQRLSIQEVIIALDSTLEGDATSLFLHDKLQHLDIKISRLAFGMPMGLHLDYVDQGSLSQALIGRKSF